MVLFWGVLGSEVVTVRARGPESETVVYAIDLPPGREGVFVIHPSTGSITVGQNGTSQLAIRNKQEVIIAFDVFAYFTSSGLNGERVR